jgi:hypothetical protein
MMLSLDAGLGLGFSAFQSGQGVGFRGALLWIKNDNIIFDFSEGRPAFGREDAGAG